MISRTPLGHRPRKPGEMVDRAVCVSECAVQGSVFDEMQRIRKRALLRNQPDKVYAALLYQAGWFVEWMEGPASGVDAVIQRAAGEPYHHNLRAIHRSQGPRRLTEPWSMAFRQDHDQPADFAARVAALEASTTRHLEPTEVWRRLSMPLAAADRDRCQRVMVCSARGTRSFELVRWLAQSYDGHITTQRLAGAHEKVQDVANDYVDLPGRPGAMARRVVAMARNGLQIGLFQAFLSDYSHVMLLLSGDSRHDMELVQLVMAACAHLPERPVLLGIGRSGGCDHALLHETARAGGLIYLDCDAAGIDPRTVWAAAEPALDFSRIARYG